MYIYIVMILVITRYVIVTRMPLLRGYNKSVLPLRSNYSKHNRANDAKTNILFLYNFIYIFNIIYLFGFAHYKMKVLNILSKL